MGASFGSLLLSGRAEEEETLHQGFSGKMGKPAQVAKICTYGEGVPKEG